MFAENKMLPPLLSFRPPTFEQTDKVQFDIDPRYPILPQHTYELQYTRSQSSTRPPQLPPIDSGQSWVHLLAHQSTYRSLLPIAVQKLVSVIEYCVFWLPLCCRSSLEMLVVGAFATTCAYWKGCLCWVWVSKHFFFNTLIKATSPTASNSRSDAFHRKQLDSIARSYQMCIGTDWRAM